MATQPPGKARGGDTLPAGSLGVLGGLRRWVGDEVIGIIRAAIGITGASEESSILGPRDRILINPKDEPQWCPWQSGRRKSPLEGGPCTQLHIPPAHSTCRNHVHTEPEPLSNFPKGGTGDAPKGHKAPGRFPSLQYRVGQK